MNGALQEFGERWNRFWFAPADPLPTALLRIGVGTVAALHFLSLSGSLNVWYARDGVLPPPAVTELLRLTSGGQSHYHWSYLDYVPASTELWCLHLFAILAAVLFAAGSFTRVSGVLTLVATLAYVHRIPQVAGHVEPVLCSLLLYLIIAPSGACLSFDAWLAKRRNKSLAVNDSRQPSLTANVGLRLIQVHVAMFYAMMGLTKLYGDAWWEGSAVWTLLAQTESRPLNFSGLRQLGSAGEYLLNLLTHAIVYFELAFPVLIWNRLTRPLVLVTSVLIWLVVMVATGQLLCGLLMVVTGAAFLPMATAGGHSK